MMIHPRPALAIIPLAILLMALSACSATATATDWFFGNTLAIRTKEIRLAEEVRYSDGGKHYVVRPKDSTRTLAVAYLEVRNRQANVVIMSINKDTVRLRDTKYLDYTPIDPLQDRAEVPEAGPREDTMAPFLWGNVSLPQQCGDQPYCELKGWVIFEVPRDIKFYQLVWDTGDTIYLYFQKD